MSTKKTIQLPTSLGYLQPFVNFLGKLPPEELIEDIDSSRLGAALRKRVRNLDADSATTVLEEDRKQLKAFLLVYPASPAHWIFGYLSLPDLAEHLIRPRDPIESGPEIAFELPPGWRVMKRIPFRLDLKKGKVFGTITAVDELPITFFQSGREHAAPQLEPPHVRVTREATEVLFGRCSGTKYLCRMTEPALSKQISYQLSVPGGHVVVWLGAGSGVDFDESPFEAKLDTIALSEPR